MHFSVQARTAVTDEVRELAQDAGDDRAIEQLGSLERATLVGRFSPQTRIRQGDTIEVAIDESALYFFDPSTGGVIYGKAAVPAAV
jgi:multiple sugar transport system ATP-binding protein